MLAQKLPTLFTQAAIRVVMMQEETYHNEAVDPRSMPVTRALTKAIEERPVDNGDAWLAAMMVHEDAEVRFAAIRVLETRAVYAKEGFDWEQLVREGTESVELANQRLMRDFFERKMGGAAGD